MSDPASDSRPRITSPWTGLALVCLPFSAFAHVDLLEPNGGEALHAGTEVDIRWEVAKEHDTQDWDLSYSTTGPGGPWIDIAVDLPPGDIAEGAVHAYAWTLPDEPSQALYVRVRQDNGGQDYEDESDGAVVLVGSAATDCNANGLADADELASGSGSDHDANGTLDACQAFSVDVAAVSISAGGTQVMQLHAGPAFAGHTYLVLGSASGTAPGTPVGELVLPLEFDGYLAFSLNAPNAPPFAQSLGVLDGSGAATASYGVPAGVLPPGQAGLLLHHAYVLFDAFGVSGASNPMPLELVP